MAPTPENIERRAAGRPPEEAKSGNAPKQAAAILEDSEERLEQAAERSAENQK
jgi:hypothetical protein